MVVNALMLLVGFKVLTATPIGWRALLPGALAGGVALWVLQFVGGIYIERVILGHSAVYGSFAVAIGLLVWLSLVARIVLLAAEINVVAAEHLLAPQLHRPEPHERRRKQLRRSRTRSIRSPKYAAYEDEADDYPQATTSDPAAAAGHAFALATASSSSQDCWSIAWRRHAGTSPRNPARMSRIWSTTKGASAPQARISVKASDR